LLELTKSGGGISGGGYSGGVGSLVLTGICYNFDEDKTGAIILLRTKLNNKLMSNYLFIYFIKMENKNVLIF
jgi:hypothetical protein